MAVSIQKSQLSLSVYYACLLIGQQWRIDNAALFSLPQDPQRMRDRMRAKMVGNSAATGTTTGRTSSSEPQAQTTNEPKQAIPEQLVNADYAELELRAMAHEAGM